MKHFVSRFSAIFGLASLLILTSVILVSSAVGQQSLADAARKARQNKPAEPTTKVFTNDDLRAAPPTEKSADDSAAAVSDKTASADDKDKAKDKDKEEKKSGDDQAAIDKEWGEKISAQKDSIALMERELDVLERENKLRAASYYGDAGTRLRDEKKYAEEDRKYRDDITTKQKAIDDAKSKLDQMRDDARKAGASPSAIS